MQYQPDDSLKRSIRAAMEQKTTEELEDIWLEHDGSAWTDEAFDAVRSILLARTHELPEPEEPETPAVQEPATPAVVVEDPIDVLMERAMRSVLRWAVVGGIVLLLLFGHMSVFAVLAVIAAVIVFVALYQLNKRLQTPPGK